MLNILKKPVITEKSLQEAADRNVYLFEVDRLANKHQIQVAVEELFSVKVLAVNTVKHQGKPKRTGRRRVSGVTAVTKKAYVHVKAGQKIAAFEVTA